MSHPFVYVICVDGLEDRKEALLKDAKNKNIDAIIWDGLNGVNSGIKGFYENGKQISCGHTSLCLNFWFLWRHLTFIDKEWFIVCEDDVVFIDGFYEKISEIIKEAEEIDLNFVYLGWLPEYKRKLKKITKNIAKLKWGYPYGLQCSLIHKSALEILIDTNKKIDDHIDVSVGKKSLPLLRWGVCSPSLFEQKSKNGVWETSLNL